jgi:hypothetical protein
MEVCFSKESLVTRGWTLQELLASNLVQFYSAEDDLLGDKISLKDEIAAIAGIPIEAIEGQALSSFDIEERFSWVSKRETSVPEAKAYCLLGIFEISFHLSPEKES